ncbi:amidase family protein [Nitriliruptor alkaliphilus]|uniref:amidase family protein n=1 Tax=Nitriliruptor alkaliphilus TaxID=427918 RepID=UPI0006991A6B|nr:amidase family protein [Nitriliruptor alkaliphilus]
MTFEPEGGPAVDLADHDAHGRAAQLGALLATQAPSPSEPTAGPAPLAGATFVAKDNIDTEDLPTTWGTSVLHDRRPARDADVVRRLRRAGAQLVGKANLHELCFGVTGEHAGNGGSANPYDPTRVAGGSSSGSAIAVSVGLVPFALGTDTGGSCRIPAAFCGVAGFRPTTGRYPMGGVLTLSATRDTVGTIARDPRLLLVLDEVLATPGCRDDTADDPARIRLGIPEGSSLVVDVDPAIARVFATARAALRQAGVDLVPIDAEELACHDQRAGFVIARYEIERELVARFARAAGDRHPIEWLAERVASPDVRDLLGGIASEPVDAGAYHEALHVHRHRLRHAYADLFEQHGLDAIVMPAVPTPPPPRDATETVRLPSGEHDAFPALTRNTSPSSVAGVPSVSVPAGLDAEGLPVGLLLDGPEHRDRRLLEIATRVAAILRTGVDPGTPPPGPVGSDATRSGEGADDGA